MPGAWDEQLHAMDYLTYAYLQGAQNKHPPGPCSMSCTRFGKPSLRISKWPMPSLLSPHATRSNVISGDEAAQLQSAREPIARRFCCSVSRGPGPTFTTRARLALRERGDTASARREVDELWRIQTGADGSQR